MAAPVNFSQRTHTGDPAALARVFDTFERLTAVRTGVQAATLAAVVWALTAAIDHWSRPSEAPTSSAVDQPSARGPVR